MKLVQKSVYLRNNDMIGKAVIEIEQFYSILMAFVILKSILTISLSSSSEEEGEDEEFIGLSIYLL
ncbi:hypothetical protein C0J52_00514 [Blattella germanica]|nr:hypothetical protein C0J52_00514 [Blattella germanica]